MTKPVEGPPWGDEKEEPTILDWLKSVLHGKPLDLPKPDGLGAEKLRIDIGRGIGKRFFSASTKENQLSGSDGDGSEAPSSQRGLTPARLRVPVAFLLGLVAQAGLEARGETLAVSVGLYLFAAALIGWAAWEGDFTISQAPQIDVERHTLEIRIVPLVLAFFFGAMTFMASGDNQFTARNITTWIASIVLLVSAFWEGRLPWFTWWDRLSTWFRSPDKSWRLKGWHLLWLLIFAISIFFRFHQWQSVPNEMVSDQAEKLLDVVDVLNGRYSIFFPRNTGREALQFYLAAATAHIFGTGITYETLKIGTILAGILTLPYVYLFTREVAGKEAGLAAMALAGIAYWPNVISRVGLRFPLYPLFAAPALYYLVRGLRRRSRNDLLVCGIIVGMGLHGYSPARVIPVAVAAGVLVFLLHREAHGNRWAVLTWLMAAGLAGLMVFVPLLRIAVDMPQLFVMRMASRLGDAERALPGPAWGIFLKNVWDGLLMFSWDNGDVWVNSIPHRPALDRVTGALYNLGIVIVAVRYHRHRRWIDAFFLLSIPILQLPSTLSLAFPGENPATNRASGAMVPVFAAGGTALYALVAWGKRQWTSRRSASISVLVATLLVLIAGVLNYNLVFDEYAQNYRRSAWNTRDAGQIIRGFAESIGDYDSAYVMAYPHWMDTRLIGMAAGKPTRDYALWADELESILPIDRPHLFLVNPRDEETLILLQELFPDGVLTRFDSALEGKDILIYFTLSEDAPAEFD